MSNENSYIKTENEEQSFSDTLMKIGSIAATSFLTGLVWSIGNNAGASIYQKWIGNNSQQSGLPPQLG
ncbi:MAG: hypothetical protein HQK49_19650 [Oligoflexia bacterium]|nr:hypothetical protein [Oligoflexia bacterium]